MSDEEERCDYQFRPDDPTAADNYPPPRCKLPKDHDGEHEPDR